jgi:hypothetical protein
VLAVHSDDTDSGGGDSSVMTEQFWQYTVVHSDASPVTVVLCMAVTVLWHEWQQDSDDGPGNNPVMAARWVVVVQIREQCWSSSDVDRCDSDMTVQWWQILEHPNESVKYGNLENR